MSYTRRVDRQNPSCLVFLVDQSGSMEDPVGGSTNTKAVAVADALNRLLYELVLRCVKDPNEGPRPYYLVGVIGYRSQRTSVTVASALGGDLVGRDLVWISDIARSPLRVETRTQAPNVHSSGETTVVRSFRFPVWLEPVADGGTPMAHAFDFAGRVVKSFIDEHPASFPPIVINITDGESTDGDPSVWAERMKGLRTDDGNVLLFNLNISSSAGAPSYFPSAPHGLDRFGQSLFSMSSPLPMFMFEAAAAQGIAATAGARGFVFNADMTALVTFLNVGTSTSHLLR